MAQQQRQTINLIPHAKIKVELSDDEDMNIACRVCNKCFVNEIALRNHVSMEHTDTFISANPDVWMIHKREEMKTEEIKRKTVDIISSMAPANLVTLASEDVDYIIIKAEDAPLPPRKRKAERGGAAGAGGAGGEKRADRGPPRAKEVTPIMGPFECLQPSTLVADGTCHQIFFSCCEYSVHFRDEHTRRRKGLRCQVCEKPLAGGDDQAPYSCEVCGAGFQANKELSNHMATDHVKLKPFQCSVCHKRFTQQGGVQQHMRMHTGDRPFPCTFCPKAFTQKSGLDQHLRIHTKVKPYRCVICAKTFCQSVHLKQHMRTHTNVSPFQCGICHKRFKQSSHLNYHLKNHNQRDMTDEQKTMYKKLVMLMQNEKTAVTYIESPDGTVSIRKAGVVLEDGEVQTEELEGGELQEGAEEEVETEEFETESVETEEFETETVESEVLFDEQEQYLAEQSIKVETQPEYVLSDVMGV